MQKIKDHFELKMSDFESVLKYPWSDPDYYKAWLAQTYFYSRRVTRILFMASAHFSPEQNQLHQRFSKHSQEEKGHEVLAERDCLDLGSHPNQVGEFSITKSFYRAQYYTIQNEGPETLFGWILALEGLANCWGSKMKKAVAQGNVELPTRFLDVHVEEDPDHVDKAFEILKSCDLKRFESPIIENMDLTADLYFSMLDQSLKWSQAAKKKKAA